MPKSRERDLITCTCDVLCVVLCVVLRRFLLGTGRMPHPVGGAMCVTLSHCREKGYHSLNIHKTTSHLAFAWLLYFDLDC